MIVSKYCYCHQSIKYTAAGFLGTGSVGSKLRQAERPAVRRTHKAGQKPGTHFYINHGGNNYGK